MKAIVIDNGSACLRELPDPGPPGPGQVRIVTQMAPINPADLLIIAYNDPALSKPGSILGAESIARVESVGPGVVGLSPGDRVIGLDRGRWAQVFTLDAERVVKVSAPLSDEHAAMLRINPPTARRLVDMAALAPGDWIVQNAGASMVARLIVLMAKEAGVRTACVVRDPERSRPILAPFAPEAVIADGPGLGARFKALSGGVGARLGVESVGGVATGWIAECLGDRGLLIPFGRLSGQDCVVPGNIFGRSRLTMRGFSLRPEEGAAGRAELQPMFDALAVQAAAYPTLFPDCVHYPLERLDEALAHGHSSRAMLTFG
jgi:trans-2-enoyl-CoA reductase